VSFGPNRRGRPVRRPPLSHFQIETRVPPPVIPWRLEVGFRFRFRFRLRFRFRFRFRLRFTDAVQCARIGSLLMLLEHLEFSARLSLNSASGLLIHAHELDISGVTLRRNAARSVRISGHRKDTRIIGRSKTVCSTDASSGVPLLCSAVCSLFSRTGGEPAMRYAECLRYV